MTGQLPSHHLSQPFCWTWQTSLAKTTSERSEVAQTARPPIKSVQSSEHLVLLPESQCHLLLMHLPLLHINWVSGSQVGNSVKDIKKHSIGKMLLIMFDISHFSCSILNLNSPHQVIFLYFSYRNILLQSYLKHACPVSKNAELCKLLTFLHSILSLC